MRYSVLGADRETGEELTIIIEAATPSAAEDAAYRRGLLVLRLDLADTHAAPPTTPQAFAPRGPTTRPPTVIEQTSKQWKALMLVFGLMVVCSLPTCALAGVVDDVVASEMLFLAGFALLAIGGIGFVVARVCAWWHHG